MGDFGDDLARMFRYPWEQWTRIFNFWWVLIPILGWFALMGYTKKIINELLAGNNKELPKFGSFGENMKTGFFFFVYTLVLGIVLGIVFMILGFVFGLIPFLGQIIMILIQLYAGFMASLMVMDYVKKGNFAAGWDIAGVNKVIINNIEEAVMTILKTLIVVIGYLLASVLIVTIVVTIPAAVLSSYYLYAEFYNKFRK